MSFDRIGSLPAESVCTVGMYYPGQKSSHLDYAQNQNTIFIMHYHEFGTVARLAATSRIAASKFHFSISRDKNSVLILCIF